MRFAVTDDQGPDFSCSGDLEIKGRRVSMFLFRKIFFMKMCSCDTCLDICIVILLCGLAALAIAFLLRFSISL